ncbi:MAG: MinD/ParA family protein [Halanaerobiales bacterium]|nr:MinD/ParA family protein [Halanaerobiales bacterium]
MSNQAAKLKEIVKEKKNNINKTSLEVAANARTIAVASGKGGVGKSTFAVNFAYNLSKLGKNVLLVDSDIGMANLDILLGVQPRFDIGHLLRGECTLEDALIEGPAGVKLLSGITGDDTFINIGTQAVKKLVNIGAELEKDFDYLLIDLGAGAAKNIINTILAVEELIIVLTSEPTSVMDSYSLIKILANHNYSRSIKLVLNQSENIKDSEKISSRMIKTVGNYLDIELEMLGTISYDRKISTAVRRQKPYSEVFAGRKAAEDIEKIAYEIAGRERQAAGIKSYFYKMIGFFNKES